MQTKLMRLAAFADGDRGGNPAGVFLADGLPPHDEMQAIAAEVGYSETAFAKPQGPAWRVRYFSPETEVPFCGHATIALGAALAREYGDQVFDLILNEARITVEGQTSEYSMSAALQSPPTSSATLEPDLRDDVLALFGYRAADLDPALPPARAQAGANHFVLTLNSREKLAAMAYEFEAGRDLMRREQLITIMFAFAETPRRFHSRNPFASGGVYEDPATGAATAAFAGYLRDLGWAHGGSIEIIQGKDMGSGSRLYAEIGDEPGSSIRVSGRVRPIEE